MEIILIVAGVIVCTGVYRLGKQNGREEYKNEMQRRIEEMEERLKDL